MIRILLDTNAYVAFKQGEKDAVETLRRVDRIGIGHPPPLYRYQLWQADSPVAGGTWIGIERSGVAVSCKRLRLSCGKGGSSPW